MFCGIGGFRLALNHFDTECVFSSDYDENAQICYKALHGEEPYPNDIRELDYHTIPDIDLLCGGFPCAKFSIAGDRMGFESDDPRALMFFELAKMLEIKKPTMFWFENVKGLLNHDEGNSFKLILRKLDELGYDVEWQCPNAKHYGIPVMRERVFIVGHLRERPTERIFPLEGKIYRYDESVTVLQWRHCYFRRFNGIVPTLTAQMGTGGLNVPYVVIGDTVRKLTPRETFRLQGLEENDIDKLINTGLSDYKLYERAGRTIFQPYSIEIAERIYKSFNNDYVNNFELNVIPTLNEW